MDIEIRTITEDERVDWIQAAETSFSSTAKDDEIEAFLPVIEIDRSFAAVDGSRIVGTSASITFRMMVPGGARVPTAGVTMVGVQPTHRRRGINSRMMTAILEQAADRGEPLAALFASEGAIYGRFGYGLAAGLGEIQAESARMAFVRGYEPSGRVELVSKEDAMPVVDRVYDAALRPGGVERNEALRDHMFATVGEDKDQAVDVRGSLRRRRGGRRVRGVLGEARLAPVDPDGHDHGQGMRRVHAFRIRGHLAIPVRRGPRGHGRSLEPSRSTIRSSTSFGSRADCASA